MASTSLSVRTVVIVTLFVTLCNGDYLFMSCHDNPNIIAWNVNTSDLWTDKLLDTSSIDWISSKDLHFRGMAIMDETLYVANSKEDKSFIGQWICKKKADVEVTKHPAKLMFIGNFTGVCKIVNCNWFPTCTLQT